MPIDEKKAGAGNRRAVDRVMAGGAKVSNATKVPLKELSGNIRKAHVAQAAKREAEARDYGEAEHYVEKRVIVDQEKRKALVEEILSHLPGSQLEVIVGILRRIEAGLCEDKELEAWLRKWKRFEAVFMAISGEEGTRNKLFTMPIRTVLADGADLDTDVMPPEAAVERLKHMTHDLERRMKGGIAQLDDGVPDVLGGVDDVEPAIPEHGRPAEQVRIRGEEARGGRRTPNRGQSGGGRR